VFLVLYFVKEALKCAVVVYCLCKGGPVPPSLLGICRNSVICVVLHARGQLLDLVLTEPTLREALLHLFLDVLFAAIPMTVLNFMFVFVISPTGFEDWEWYVVAFGLITTLKLFWDVLGILMEARAAAKTVSTPY
jgi:hypothetical protein